MKPFVRSLIAIGSLGALTVVAGPALAEETGVAADMLECPKTGQQPRGAARSEAHGFVQLIDEALAQSNLQEQQARTLSQIGQQVDAKTAAVHDARRDLMLALAQQMEAGQINRQALEPQVRALVSAKDQAGPAMKQALEQIHQTLNPEQRKAFADALERSVQQRMQMHESGQWLNQWTQELGLNEQQKQQVQTILNQLKPVAEQHHAQFNKVLSSFRGQSFNIEQIVPTQEAHKQAQDSVERMIGIAQQVSQVLTPQQRALAARKIVQNACPKMAPQQTGTPQAYPQTGQQTQPLDGENIGTSEDELIVGRGFGAGYGRGLWGGYGRGFYRGVNRYGGYWSPGFGYYGGAYPYGASFAYPYAASYAYPYSYGYAYPYAYNLGYGGIWPGYSAYSYSYPYLGGYSFFW